MTKKSKPIFYTEAVKRATIKYESKNIKRITLKLNKKTDIDIIDYLDKQGKGNVNLFLKKIIRENMNK